MYQPTTDLGDRLVIAHIDGRYLPGVFTGETGQFGEHFEIRFDDIFGELYDTPKTARLHYEDLHKSCEENDHLLG